MRPMGATLAGKWVWIWNWRRSDGGDAEAVASRLHRAGCRGVLIKAFDGARWFPQGSPWREIARSLRTRGLAVGGWGYCYGRDPAGEARRAVETARYGEADLLVLDVEGEFEGRPQAAEELCVAIRQALGSEYPLYYSTFALARLHPSFPYREFHQLCSGAVPQVYWNALRLSPEQALTETYSGYRKLGIPSEHLFPAAGLYREGKVPYPTPGEVRAFAAAVARMGSRGISLWSYEHMNAAMWTAIASVPWEDREMLKEEIQRLNRAVSDLEGRVSSLEVQLRALKRRPTRRRTYTVQPGDTLAGIAARLGIRDWRSLYEANRGVIGPDPDIIQPGQVLVVP